MLVTTDSEIVVQLDLQKFTEFGQIDFILMIVADFMLMIVVAVSYTHLDVYKRQDL